jgi:CubicO group peptidase (beta-lactamase class C family)
MINMKYLILSFIGCFFISFPQSFAQLSPKESRIITEFSKDLGDDIKKDNLHGSISAAIIKKGHVIWAGAIGYADMSGDTSADTGTIYRIASITKVFTVTILMQLVEEEKVRLDDPVENYVPEVKSIQGYPKNTKITLRQLASHTSGLNREPDLPGSSLGPPDQWENIVLSSIPQTSFNGSPGGQFLYSNIGFALLGLALERASGVSYIQMVQQRIFTPLNMNNSFFAVPEDKRYRLAQGIDNNKEGAIDTILPLRQVEGMGYRVPNGGIWSTPSDLAKFAIAFMGGYPLLKPKSIREMLVIPPGGKNYGLGMMIRRDRQMTLIGHNGSDPGYKSQLAIEPISGDAVILMRNYNVGKTNLEETARDLLERL